MARYFVFFLFALSSAFCQAQAFVLTYSDHCKHQNFSSLLHNDKVILPDVSQQLLPNDSFVSYSTDLLIIDAQSFAYTRKAIQPQDTNVQYAIEWIVPCPDGYLGFGASINSISNDRDFLMVQFDTGFTIIRDTFFIRENTQEYLEDIEILPDGGIVAVVSSGVVFMDSNISLYHFDYDLNLIDSMVINDVFIVDADIVFNAEVNKFMLCTAGDEMWYIIDNPSFTIDTSAMLLGASIADWWPSSSLASLKHSGFYQAVYKRQYMPGTQTQGWKLGYIVRDSAGNRSALALSHFAPDTTMLLPNNCLLSVSADTLIRSGMISTHTDLLGYAPHNFQYWSNPAYTKIIAHSMSGEKYWEINLGDGFHWEPTYLMAGSDRTFYLLGLSADSILSEPKYGWFLVHFNDQGQVLQVHKQAFSNREVPVFPNPSSGRFSLNSPCSGDVQVSVFDGGGRLIQQKEVRSLVGQEVQFDLSGQVSGLFHIVLKCKQDVYYSKVLIQ